MKARRWVALGIGLFILLFSLITTVSFAFNTYSSTTEAFFGGSEEKIVRQGDTSGTIALLEVNGPIINSGEPGIFDNNGYNHTTFLNDLHKAMNRSDVEGIIIHVDTPGGGVLESAEIHRAVVEAQTVKDKPVYISMGGMAASGGYYLAAPAEKIYANPQTLTGSIGVIMSSMNITELLDNLGIEEHVYKSGPYKDMMSPTREPLEEEDEIIQTIVDEYYDEFVSIIAEGRDMDEDRVRELGDGRIFTGNQALEEGLIDSLGSLDDVIDDMQTDLGRNYQVVTTSQFESFGSLFGLAANQLFGSNEPEQKLHEFNQPRALYMYDYE